MTLGKLPCVKLSSNSLASVAHHGTAAFADHSKIGFDILMLPILFTWQDGALYTYTTLFSLAGLLGGWLWIREGKRMLPAIATDQLVNAALFMFFAGLLGARTLFIITNLEHYESGLFSFTRLNSGGIVFLGGAIAGALALWRWSTKHRLPWLITFNAATPGLIFAHALGRLGCFAHGCCYGKSCDLPWAITYTNPASLARPLGTPLHPTQIYEVLGLVLLGFWTLRENRKDRSQSLRFYLLGYGILRFIVEFFRGDLLRGAYQGLSTSQWVSLAMIICSLFLDFKGPSEHNSAHENRT